MEFKPKPRPTLHDLNIDKLGPLVDTFMGHYSGSNSLVELHKILDNWHAIVGDKIASIATPKEFETDTGKLTLQVKNSMWRNELSFLKISLIENLNIKLGDNTIQDIILR